MKTKTVHDFLAFKEKTPSVCESCDEEFELRREFGILLVHGN